MSDSDSLPEQNETPEDVASLYSWANLHGAKYRDFSASRAEMREKARLRLEQVIEEEQQRARQAAEAQRSGETLPPDDEARKTQLAALQAERLEAEREAAQEVTQRAAQEAAERAAQESSQHAAQEAAQRAAQENAQRAAQEAAERAAQETAQREAHEAARRATREAQEEAARQAAQEQARRAAEQAAQQVKAAQLAAQQAQAAQQAHAAQEAAQQSAWQQAWRDRFPAQPAASIPGPEPEEREPSQSHAAGTVPPQFRPAAAAPAQEEVHTAPRASSPANSFPGNLSPGNSSPGNPWAAPEAQENVGRPAWLMPERTEPASQPVLPHTPDDTLQGSRDRLAARWYALRSVFEIDVPPAQSQPAPVVSRAPVIAVFSLAGGVGKTSLVATLGRVLSGRGERVLLVDTAAYGLLPFFFGARDQRPGMLRTFSPPAASGDAPIQMITLDPETLGHEIAGQEALSAEISKHARGLSRVIVDLATASGATTRRVMRMAPHILVPLVPDMCSVVSVSSIDAFFDHNNGASGKSSLPYYVLNQFDASLPLHLDVREVLREQLGDRLLPFALRRAPALSEALAEGMTVMDYAPNSGVAEDFASLAGWVKSLSAPASTSFRGVRWSER